MESKFHSWFKNRSDCIAIVIHKKECRLQNHDSEMDIGIELLRKETNGTTQNLMAEPRTIRHQEEEKVGEVITCWRLVVKRRLKNEDVARRRKITRGRIHRWVNVRQNKN